MRWWCREWGEDLQLLLALLWFPFDVEMYWCFFIYNTYSTDVLCTR